VHVCSLIRDPTAPRGLGTAATEVTESYISQLLTRKKLPGAPGRTDIYNKMERTLKLPVGKLSELVDLQRRDELRRTLSDGPTSFYQKGRELVLRKCAPAKEEQTRLIFEKEPFGALERLVTPKLLDTAKGAAQEEPQNKNWLHGMARSSGRSCEQMRVIVLEFLDADVFNVSVDDCVSFLDPQIGIWDIDLASCEWKLS
jgi:hypothetical protein